MNTQNKSAYIHGDPLSPLANIARNKAGLINPIIGLDQLETMGSISFMLAVIQDLTDRYDHEGGINPRGEAGLQLLIDIMQSAISYEVQQGVRS